MHLFLVKFQKGIITKGDNEKGWHNETSYPVFDVYKYTKKDKETEISHIITKFLVCNSETGEMKWIDAKGLFYAGE